MIDDGKIHFRCGHCNRRVGVAKAHAGQRGKCPRCQKSIAIPCAPAPITAPMPVPILAPVPTVIEESAREIPAVYEEPTKFCSSCGGTGNMMISLEWGGYNPCPYCSS
jgi:DNA-directed RNA polymerase subunit RPC12/RpoP